MNRLTRMLELPQVVRRNISVTIAHLLIRTHPSDQYLVSYPRSGSTWVRTILTGIMDPTTCGAPEAFNRLLPGVSGSRLPLIWKLNDPRIIHSHTVYTRRLPRAIYLVRDGRDVVVSYYHYIVTREGLKLPFPEWFDLYCRRWYGPRWHENVESWLMKGRKHLGRNLLVVKFEDLKANPAHKMREITTFLGLQTEPHAVSDAIEMASLEKARRHEKRLVGKLDNPDSSFYRGGKVGQWRDQFDEHSYKRFMRMSGRALNLAGYRD